MNTMECVSPRKQTADHDDCDATPMARPRECAMTTTEIVFDPFSEDFFKGDTSRFSGL